MAHQINDYSNNKKRNVITYLKFITDLNKQTETQVAKPTTQEKWKAELVERIENMRKPDRHNQHPHEDYEDEIYNQAINDIIKIIK